MNAQWGSDRQSMSAYWMKLLREHSLGPDSVVSTVKYPKWARPPNCV